MARLTLAVILSRMVETSHIRAACDTIDSQADTATCYTKNADCFIVGDIILVDAVLDGCRSGALSKRRLEAVARTGW